VTFLLTDVERSSARWDERAAEMAAALAQHDAVVREAVAGGGGVVFSTAGDGFAAAFDTAQAAAATAVAMQQGLEAAGSPLRVRMGLHTGETDEREGDYFGPTLNRAGRLRDIAHGGQVLCSELTSRLLSEGLRPVELVDLGEHRLRDLSRPERVWQIGASESFPPLRSTETLPGNLPTQLTEFFGREAELSGLRDAFVDARLVTLTGVGGAGKSRLALQYAADTQPDFRDGAWSCALAPLTSSDAVGPLLASVVGAGPASDGGWPISIAGALKTKEMLLIFDNCEHVLDAAAELVDAVVSECPNVVVLATSREGLGVGGERIVPVGPLASSPAVSLFLSRARDVRPLREVDDETLVSVEHVCQRLDGIPLAIELAAARTQSLSVREIARLLDDRFSLLTRGARTALSHHQTLEAAIDWSFDLLSEAEQRMLMRASVFAGGFTLDAMATMCAAEGPARMKVLDLVDALVRRSLLTPEDTGLTTRYRMLETIRQYGEERLAIAGDAAEISRAHLAWCTSFAVEVGEQLRGREDASAMARMQGELDNLRSALQYAVANNDFEASKRLLLSAPIGALWDNPLGAAMASLAASIAPDLGQPDHPVTAALLTLLALDHALRFEGDEAVNCAERACEVARSHGDWLRTSPWLAWLLASLVAGRRENVALAADEARAHAQTERDAFAVAEWEAQTGIARWMAGDFDDAQHCTERALELADAIGAANLIMRNAFLRGASLLARSADPTLAFECFQRAVQLGARLGGNVLHGGAAWALLLSPQANDASPAALAREVAEHVPTPMFVLDAVGTLVYFNDAGATLIGKPFSQIGQIGAAQFADVLELATTSGERLRRRDTPAGVAMFQRRPAHQRLMATGYDGVRRTIDTSAYPLLNEFGENDGVLCVFWQELVSEPGD
jgi:predicted ATPase/class 3 adenylate cyclase